MNTSNVTIHFEIFIVHGGLLRWTLLYVLTCTRNHNQAYCGFSTNLVFKCIEEISVNLLRLSSLSTPRTSPMLPPVQIFPSRQYFHRPPCPRASLVQKSVANPITNNTSPIKNSPRITFPSPFPRFESPILSCYVLLSNPPKRIAYQMLIKSLELFDWYNFLGREHNCPQYFTGLREIPE